MKVNEMFPKRFFSGEDLPKNGIKVTIAEVKQEKSRPAPGAQELDIYVLYLEKAKKGTPLSRPLAIQIQTILETAETDQWIGKSLILHPVPMTVANKPRIAVRARKVKETHTSDEDF